MTITFNREWAMPNESTFDIPPIGEFVDRIMAKSPGLWVDPYCGGSKVADYTNDLNPEIESDRTMYAVDFLREIPDGSVSGGVIFDPAYSPRQIKEVYDSIGLEVTMETTQATYWSEPRKEIERVCADGAWAMTFGWNSGGVGKTKDFVKDEILLVCHGGWHNDTICVAEQYREGSYDG